MLQIDLGKKSYGKDYQVQLSTKGQKTPGLVYLKIYAFLIYGDLYNKKPA